MTFAEKIDKVLKTNEKEIRSLGQLESFLGLGTHTIRSAIKEKREPSRKIQVKIVEGLGVNWTWWETGEGEIFAKKGTSVVLSDGKPEMLKLLGVIDYLEEKVKTLTDELNECKKKHGTV